MEQGSEHGVRKRDDVMPAPAILRRALVREAAGAAIALALAGCAAAQTMGWSSTYVLTALALFALTLGPLAHALTGHAPHRRFGPGNRVTLGRLALVMLLAAVLPQPLQYAEALAWALVVAATTAALLDAADGPLARRSGLASPFGARFDMETDALLILVLCALLIKFDKAGTWVLASGAMRYAFVAAALRWSWLAAPLPPSRRRQTVCVLQIVALIVGLGPIVSTAVSSALAAAALLLLAGSFAVDIRWLARQRAMK